MSNKEVVMVGPLPMPLTGQSSAFKYFVENYKFKKSVFNYSFSKESTFSFLVKSGFFILKFISYIIFNRCLI
ncbi:hypothetical protein J8B21_14430, partial [Vibrio parahaemolyticus]|nr:hypothetical protein [Vibrio parahaemolyticus]